MPEVFLRVWIAVVDGVGRERSERGQTTAEYARVRSQFGHPIGFFQAVKHPIVNMMCAVDRARSLVYAAAAAIDNDPKDALRLARMAKAAASDTAALEIFSSASCCETESVSRRSRQRLAVI